ncbi:hypothetical protein MKW98_009041 [Papaver atlanticum]|uniref:Uncharacterized protein n=1 Tax=Papaver atlanticum TaxID=357466 RepID=A0AAD4X477_9MAGN|nr:hypothetical protein MKW98_009041 [Papaver atlanticum]
MALRATGRLLSQRLSIGVSRNFSAKAVSSENVQKRLLDERCEKMILVEIRALTASAENSIAYWEPLAVKEKITYLNRVTVMSLFAICMAGDLIHTGKTGKESCFSLVRILSFFILCLLCNLF